MFKRQVTDARITERYVSLYQRAESVAEQVCKAAERPDLYATIMQANQRLVVAASNVGRRLSELEPLLVQLRLAAYEACTAGSRPELYEPLVQANLQVVQAALDIARLRSRNRKFDLYIQQWVQQGRRFQQGIAGLHFSQ